KPEARLGDEMLGGKLLVIKCRFCGRMASAVKSGFGARAYCGRHGFCERTCEALFRSAHSDILERPFGELFGACSSACGDARGSRDASNRTKDGAPTFRKLARS